MLTQRETTLKKEINSTNINYDHKAKTRCYLAIHQPKRTNQIRIHKLFRTKSLPNNQKKSDAPRKQNLHLKKKRRLKHKSPKANPRNKIPNQILKKTKYLLRKSIKRSRRHFQKHNQRKIRQSAKNKCPFNLFVRQRNRTLCKTKKH